MELNTISLGDFVKLATVIFEKAAESLNRVMAGSGLVRSTPIPMNSGNTREFTEIDLEEYASLKGQGDQATRASVQQGYSITMTAKRIAKDIGITYEMRTQNKYTEVVSRLTNLAKLAWNRLELDLQHRLTFGTATTYVDRDGETVTISVGDTLALFSTVHKLKGSATTYRNRLANNPKLAKGSLEGAERLVTEETLNQFGEKVTIPFDILWTSDDPNVVNVAREYLQSTADISAPNAGVVNVYKGKYRHVVLTRLATDKNGAVDTSKRDFWGLASSMASDFHLGVWENPRLKVPSDLNAGEDFATDDWNFGVRAGYGLAVLSGRWIKFSSGDGTA